MSEPIDLTKLSPAPWEPDYEDGTIEGILMMAHHANINTAVRLGEDYSRTNLAFVALARNAFDIMTRRMWFPRFVGTVDGQQQWMAYSWVALKNVCEIAADFRATECVRHWLYPDPYTAIVETEKWYCENVEESQTL